VMYVMPNSTVSDTTRESAQPHFSHSLLYFRSKFNALKRNGFLLRKSAA